jgi:putative transposase
MTIGRATYEPGWKWSVHVGPGVGAQRCNVEHIGLVLSGCATAAIENGPIHELLKGASSRWMNETHGKGFSWQEGYGAFTLGVSQKPRTIDYIKRQAEHHRKRSFEEEFVAFLKKHAIDYNPKYVWG